MPYAEINCGWCHFVKWCYDSEFSRSLYENAYVICNVSVGGYRVCLNRHGQLRCALLYLRCFVCIYTDLSRMEVGRQLPLRNRMNALLLRHTRMYDVNGTWRKGMWDEQSLQVSKHVQFCVFTGFCSAKAVAITRVARYRDCRGFG